MKSSLLFTAFLLFCTCIQAQHFAGNYRGDQGIENIQVNIQHPVNGEYKGNMSDGKVSYKLVGIEKEGKLTGSLYNSQGYLYFSLSSFSGRQEMVIMQYNAYDQPVPSSAVKFSLVKTTNVQQTPSDNSIVQKKEKSVYFNGVKATSEIISGLEQMYKVKVMEGRYWYDQVSGLWGLEGGPTVGVILPNLNLGGKLQANASNGKTGVVINGRVLPQQDLQYLQNLVGYIQPGRYWLDAYGNAGKEGGPVLGNLMQAANNTRNNNSGGSTFYRNNYTGIGGGSSGGTTYVIGSDFSYIGGN
ncbi:hypothetical protein [Flexithrix dorotheae]|uniref:hypothetical protein n=1 Tax=Flexithrix dorotheae TaxID=70993 RepID=UPI000361E4F4|nr:hypothetical protein [Flexithrix dorotheae]